MGIRDYFSKRATRAARAGQRDVYQYDVLPNALRVQVVHIWQRSVGEFIPFTGSRMGGGGTIWHLIEASVAEEHGVFKLGNDGSAFSRCAKYFLNQNDIAKALDMIEAVFLAVDEHIRPNLQYASGQISQHPEDAIHDLNRRFQEHSVGYQYIEGQL